MASQRRTLRIGSYGSNTGLKALLHLSSSRQILTPSEAITLPDSTKLSPKHHQQKYLHELWTSPQQLQRHQQASTSPPRSSRLQITDHLPTTAEAITLPLNPLSQTQRYSRAISNDRRVLDSKNEHHSSSNASLYNPQISGYAQTVKVQPSMSNTIAVDEQKVRNRNLNNFRHINEDKVVSSFMVNLRVPSLLQLSTKGNSNNQISRNTVVSPFNDNLHSSDYQIKSARDATTHYERAHEHKRIGTTMNKAQITFDTNLREYSRNQQPLRQREASWIASPSRNHAFDLHQDIKRSRGKSSALDTYTKNIAYSDYPIYTEKLQRHNYLLQRVLRKDIESSCNQHRKAGDVSQSSLKWQLSLNSYPKQRTIPSTAGTAI